MTTGSDDGAVGATRRVPGSVDIGPADGGVVRIELHGEIDLVVANAADQTRLYSCLTADRVDLDLSDVSFIDSTGLALLVRIRSLCPGPTRVVAASPRVTRLLQLTGLSAAFDLP